MSINPETFMKDWLANEFYLLVKFHAWQAKAQNEYSKLMAAKAGAK